MESKTGELDLEPSEEFFKLGSDQLGESCLDPASCKIQKKRQRQAHICDMSLFE